MRYRMTDHNYKVAWKRKAAIKFAKLYNADHRRVLKNTNHLLSINPYRIADGIADFSGYPFNGYLWAIINGEVAELFYGISPDEDHED
jgi:hypothetical protein